MNYSRKVLKKQYFIFSEIFSKRGLTEAQKADPCSLIGWFEAEYWPVIGRIGPVTGLSLKIELESGDQETYQSNLTFYQRTQIKSLSIQVLPLIKTKKNTKPNPVNFQVHTFKIALQVKISLIITNNRSFQGQ